MKEIDLEKSLRKTINCAPGLDFEELAKIPVVKMTEHDYITRQQRENSPKQKHSPRYIRQLSLTFASCVIVLVCFSAWFVEFKTPDSIIDLDVNPSIQIVTNKHNQVLSVKALNEDARAIIEGQNFEQANLDESVNLIVTSMISQGYIAEDKNVILISVENKSAEQANNLAVSVDQVVKDTASTQDIATTVLRQTLTEDKEATALAEEYSVSTGKLKMIQEIASSSEALSIEQLAPMSVTDLIKVSKENAVDLNKIIQSDDDYLAEKVAEEIVEDDLQTATDNTEIKNTKKDDLQQTETMTTEPVTIPLPENEDKVVNDGTLPEPETTENMDDKVPESKPADQPVTDPGDTEIRPPLNVDKDLNSVDTPEANEQIN